MKRLRGISLHSKKYFEKNQGEYIKHKTAWVGFIKVNINKTSWDTSIFPDSKTGTYVLPVKASIRKMEGLFDGDVVKFSITLI